MSPRPLGRVLPAATACFLLLPAGLQGGVRNSPHDLPAQDYHVAADDSFQGECKVCHLPVSRPGPNFFGEIPPSLRRYRSSSLMCFSCHDGTTIVSPDVDASTTAFHPRSHGYDLESMRQSLPGALDLPSTEGSVMACITCHNPHDNGNRPFLMDEPVDLCTRCHKGMEGGADARRGGAGNHPLDVEPLGSSTETSPVTPAPAFLTPFPRSYPLGGGKSRSGVHWDLGGHLSDGATGTLTCLTCHVVHGDEDSPPREKLLTVDPVNKTANLFCEACHQGQRGDGRDAPPYPNPGGTTAARTYHPCDDDIGNGEGPLVEIREPEGWPFGEGTPRPLLCTTCHAAHLARQRTALLRRTKLETSFCEECHEGVPSGGRHHPMVVVGEGRCMLYLSPPVYGEIREKLQCTDCHRAHNAGLGTDLEERYAPLLRSDSLAEGTCLPCHPTDNPTCLEDELSMASHFLGDPSSEETYEDQDPPLREDPWPESGLLSYNGPEGKMVTCFSCHTFEEQGIISGDDGQTGYLLAKAGNPVEWGDDGENTGSDAYLCTGCHGVSPKTKGSGGTHPLMSADITKMNVPLPPVSVTPAGRMNCDSCHRSHGAVTGSGYYILEAVTGENVDPLTVHPDIKFDILCNYCHTSDKY